MFYSLLLTFYWLLATFTRYSLHLFFAFQLLLVAFYSFLVTIFLVIITFTHYFFTVTRYELALESLTLLTF